MLVRLVPKLILWVTENHKLGKEWKQGNTCKEKYLEVKKTVCLAKCKNQKGKDLETLCSGMIRNVMCLRLQRGWSKLIRILLMSIEKEIMMMYCQNVMKKRIGLGKVIMRSFWTQCLHGTGIVCPRQILLSAYLVHWKKTW